MARYEVEIGTSFIINACNDEEAKSAVANRLDELLPSDGYIFGETLSGSDLIIGAEEVQE